MQPALSVVTGANRGIGLGLVRHLAGRGRTVVATAREPAHAAALSALTAGGKVSVVACDVTDPAGVARLAAAVGDAPIELLVNNAGSYGGDAQSLGAIDHADCVRTFEINALGPLRVTEALLPGLRRHGAGARIISITSGMGSIGDNGSGGYYAYRMSKAALNMASRSLAIDLRRDGIISAVINPGWVQTDMGGPSAPTSVDDSVTGMLREIDALTLDDSGTFRNWKGGSYPW